MKAEDALASLEIAADNWKFPARKEKSGEKETGRRKKDGVEVLCFRILQKKEEEFSGKEGRVTAERAEKKACMCVWVDG